MIVSVEGGRGRCHLTKAIAGLRNSKSLEEIMADRGSKSTSTTLEVAVLGVTNARNRARHGGLERPERPADQGVGGRRWLGSISNALACPFIPGCEIR